MGVVIDYLVENGWISAVSALLVYLLLTKISQVFCNYLDILENKRKYCRINFLFSRSCILLEP